MNSASLFRFAEWAVLILVALAALGLAFWPRRRLARMAGEAKTKAGKWLWAALECALFPVLALWLVNLGT